MCYLLNEVLNRELIRSNFQFLKPSHEDKDNNLNEDSPLKNNSQEQHTNEEVEELDRKI